MSVARGNLEDRIWELKVGEGHPLLPRLLDQLQEIIAQWSPDGFYVNNASGYTNVAVLSGGLVAECDVNLQTPDEGYVGVYQLSQCSDVLLRIGPILGVPRGERARLVLNLLGPSNDIMAYWVAETEREEQDLWKFGKGVIANLANLQPARG